MKIAIDQAEPDDSSTYARIAQVTVVIAIVSMFNAQLPSSYGPIAPIWISSGIGLAALLIYGWRLWPALFLGNLGSTALLIYGQGFAEVDWRSVVVATAIAAGSTAKGLLGCYLVHRWVGWPSTLIQTHSILKFLLAVTILPGALGATVAVTVATWYGNIYPEDYAFAWLTWAVSQALGNCTVTIVLLTLAGKPQEIWRTRRYSVAIPALLIAVLATSVLVYQSRSQLRSAEELHNNKAILAAKQLDQTATQLLSPIYGLRSFFDSSNFVDRDEFRRFVSPTISRLPELRALEWAPRVSAAEVPEIIAQAQRDGFGEYELRERRNNGLQPVASRPFYYPVLYAEPLEANRKSLGYDLGSDPEQLNTLRAALRYDRPVVSAPIQLAGNDQRRFGVMVAMPVYKEPDQKSAVESDLAGFVVSTYDIDKVVATAMQQQPLAAHTRLRVFYSPQLLQIDQPVTNFSDSTLVFDSGELRRNGPGNALASVPTWRYPLLLGERRWVLEFSSNDRFIHGLRDISFYFTLIMTLVITLVGVAFLLIVTGQTHTVRLQVVERTRELSRTNSKLVSEASRHQITSARLKQRSRELQRSNEELSHFAYIASHDLQEPLRSITGFTQLLQKRYKGQIDERADEYLRFITAGAERMRTLIVDLLAFSRIDQHKNTDSLIDLEQLLGAVKEDLRTAITISGAKIEHGPLGTVTGDKSMLRIALENLIGNSIKYQPEGQQPVISLSVQAQQEHWLFQVTDNGIGIAEEFRANVFIIFKRLHHREEYSGTGIGLAMVKKIVEQRGGKIWIETVPQGGTLFQFTWPRKAPLDLEADLE